MSHENGPSRAGTISFLLSDRGYTMFRHVSLEFRLALDDPDVFVSPSEPATFDTKRFLGETFRDWYTREMYSRFYFVSRIGSVLSSTLARM